MLIVTVLKMNSVPSDAHTFSQVLLLLLRTLKYIFSPVNHRVVRDIGYFPIEYR